MKSIIALSQLNRVSVTALVAVRIEIGDWVQKTEGTDVTALVAVRFEIENIGSISTIPIVTALVAVRIEIRYASPRTAPADCHRPCGGED